MKKRILILMLTVTLFVSNAFGGFNFIYADEKLKLELNNKSVSNEHKVLAINGVSYLKYDKISNLLNMNYYWQSNTKTLYLSQIKDNKEYIISFTEKVESNSEVLELKKAENIEKIKYLEEYFSDMTALILSEDEATKLRKFTLENGIIKQVILDFISEVKSESIEDNLENQNEIDKNIDSLSKKFEKKVFEEKYVLVDGEIYLPIKALVQDLGYNIKWDDSTKSVLINTVSEDLLPKRELTKPENTNENTKDELARIEYTEEDLILLAKIATVEAGGGSENKMLAVCNVVLNRVEDSRFPNSIAGVIYEPNQFPPAHRESFKTMKPYDKALSAAKRALHNENNVPKVLFFNMVPFPSKSADEFFGEIEGDYFYY